MAKLSVTLQIWPGKWVRRRDQPPRVLEVSLERRQAPLVLWALGSMDDSAGCLPGQRCLENILQEIGKVKGSKSEPGQQQAKPSQVTNPVAPGQARIFFLHKAARQGSGESYSGFRHAERLSEA